MLLSEEDVVKRLIELQTIDNVSSKFIKHLFLYDLSPLLVFRPSLWNDGFILSLIDSSCESLEDSVKEDVDNIFMQRIIEVISNKDALAYYYPDPLKLIDEIAIYMNETLRYAFVTIDDMSDNEADIYKTHILQEYLNMVTERFHLITDQIFRRYDILELLLYGHDDTQELPDYAICIKNLHIDVSNGRTIANLFVYEMIRRDLCQY